MPELAVNYGLALNVESTAGTWGNPAMATDALRLAEEPEVEVGYVLPGGREQVAVGGFGTPPSATPLGRFGRISFATELVGSGTVDTAPRWARILETFMAETVNASTNVQYNPSAAQKKTLSLLIQHGGLEYQIRGAVPEQLRLEGSPDAARVMIRGTIAGILNAGPSAQALEAQTFGAQGATPTPFIGAFTINAVVMIYEEFQFDFGLEARAHRVDRNETSGLKHGIVTQTNPTVNFPPEVVALGTHDPFAAQADPTTARAYSQRLGDTAGNQYIITADHAEYDAAEAIPLRSNNGVLYYSPLNIRIKRPASGTFLQIQHD